MNSTRPAPRWLVAGALVGAALAVVALGWRPDLPAAIVLAAAAVPLAFIDAAEHRLPDRILLPAGALVLLALVTAAAATSQWDALLRGLLAAMACGAGYLVLALMRPTGLGLGDVKLGMVLGLWLGWLGWAHVLVGVVAAMILGGCWAMGMVLGGRARGSDAMAFGPWLLLGAAVATVWTDALLVGAVGGA